MINNDCYEFKEFNFEDGFLDSFIDATYIITMKNSSRHENIKKQLKDYHPTKKLYILCNYGFKNCKKILKDNSSSYDLIDANFQVLYHAKKNNFNNILILEDDFIFDPSIKDKEIINEIKDLFLQKKNENFYFNLGPIPFIFYPTIKNIYKSILCYTSHANIYNKKIIDNIIYKNVRDIKHWDVFLTFNYNNYFYKYPLCYQTFPETDNQKNWHFEYNNIFLDKGYKFIIQIAINFFKILNLDIEPLPGYNNMYIFFFTLNYILFTFFILFLLFIIKNLYII